MTTTVRGKIKGQYATVAEAKADRTLKVGDNVKTSGYSTTGDGGGADYIVVLNGTGTTDNILFINTDNSLQLQRLGIGIKEFETTEDALPIPWLGIGDVISVEGRRSANDGGVADYTVVANGTGTSDGGAYIDKTDPSGYQLKLITSESIHIRSYDVQGDESSDLAKFQACVDFCASNNKTIIGDGSVEVIFSDRFTAKSNLRITGNGMTLKASPSNPSVNGLVMGITSGVSKVEIKDCIFDGGLLEGSTSLFPMTQMFQCSKIQIEDCSFLNSGGIALNISTNTSEISIINNEFENIGFTDGVGGVNAKQAIAFSSGGHTNTVVRRNSFKSIGLDCISIGGITGGDVSGNYHADDSCYALIYNDALSVNINISENRAKTAVNVGGSARPEGLGIDLPLLQDSVVSDNICKGCSSGGLGIFSGSTGVQVTGNYCVDSNQSGAGIHDAGIIVRLTSGPINLAGNFSGNAAGSTQTSGFIIDNSQGTLISVQRSNKTNSVTNGVLHATFASPVDVGTTIYTYDIPLMLQGNGTPEGVVSAPIGSEYSDLTGGAGLTSYYKETGSGSTGWALK